MDTGKLIGEVARRHQVLLDPDDPVLVMGTVSEMAMEPTVERMEAIAREVQATASQCAGLVREIRGAVPGITREVGDRFLDHHTHYTTAATRRTALIYTVIVLAFGALCWLGGWVLRYRPERTKRPDLTDKRTKSERHAAWRVSSGVARSGLNPTVFSDASCWLPQT